MAIPSYRIFFDTSVYIAALLSPKGAAGELIRLAEARAITMVVSDRVIIESDEVLSAKFPTLIQESRKLWKSLGPEIAAEPTKQKLAPFRKVLPNADAAIIATAQGAQLDAFVTWNTRDFMKPEIKKLVDFPIVLPGECLELFRQWIEPYLD